MFKARTSTSSQKRRGVILLVVVALLTLFAIVGLSFVLYAQAEANSMRIAREAQDISGTEDIDPEMLLSWFMSQLLFDAPDDESGAYSAMRGHGLARNMYGENPGQNNDVPFNGLGRPHTKGYDTTGPGAIPATYMNPFYSRNLAHGLYNPVVPNPAPIGATATGFDDHLLIN